MSKVLSFRLDEDNPREAQAMEVIQAWASRGYSLRYLLVEALLVYEDKGLQDEDISSTLEQIISMLQELRVETGFDNGLVNQKKRLSEPFLSAIVKITRPGLNAK